MKQFGGAWTEKKIEKVKKYLDAYVKVMKHQRFYTIYIDAFAGTGYRKQKDQGCSEPSLLEIEDIDTDESRELKNGSVKEALKVDPQFDKYIFIEKRHNNCSELQKIKEENPQANIEIVEDDANKALLGLCHKWQNFDRAVLFLDPFGMQVEWETLKAVAATRKIDVWYLFPSGIGVTRNLPNHIQAESTESILFDKIFGSHDWLERFYKKDQGFLMAGNGIACQMYK